MSQEVAQTELQEQSQELLNGPLKHIRAAALAAALVPLASVFAAPASAQGTNCGSGSCPTISGTVFNDANHDGIRESGETGLENVPVNICQLCDGTDTITVFTDSSGNYSVEVPAGTYTVYVTIPTGKTASPPNQGSDDSVDSDGVTNGAGASAATALAGGNPTGFGFYTSAASNPGTGTPGYWKNHPEAWPSFTTITIGGIDYTKDTALATLGKVTKDRTTAMFAQLLPALLNMAIGNDVSCVDATIAAANAWLVQNPVGSNVSGGSAAWQVGDPIHDTLDAYNNGRLCAPHRK